MTIAFAAAPPAMQRARGRGEIVVARRGEASRLERLFQEGAAKIRLPKRHDGAVEAVLINTAGGLTGGDAIDWQAHAGTGAHLVLTTQACEKVYRSSSTFANVSVRIAADEDSSIAWLPQETILFDRSMLDRRLDVDLGSGARFLGVEAVLFGRTARGETVNAGSLRDTWRVRRNGMLVHAENVRLDGDIDRRLSAAAAAAGGCAVATILLVDQTAPERIDEVRAEVVRHPHVAAGASAWRVGGHGKLLARLVARDGYSLRQALAPLVGLLNGTAGLPRIWAT